MGREQADTAPMSKLSPSSKPHKDARFALHHRQPRADKLDVKQRRVCNVDLAFRTALETRVANPVRFAAFIDGHPSYTAVDRLCPKCGSYRRRTRDRSCYTCHLNGSGENFERMKAGVSTIVARSKDSHLDRLARMRRERNDEHEAHVFGAITVRRWPTGKLEITWPDGEVEADLNDRTGQEVWNAMERFPDLKDALVWAGWYSR